MRTRISGVLVALAIALLVPTAAVAADTPGAVTFHGTFYVGNAWCGGTPVIKTMDLAGDWNLNVNTNLDPAGRAVASLVVRYPGGGLHALWTRGVVRLSPIAGNNPTGGMYAYGADLGFGALRIDFNSISGDFSYSIKNAASLGCWTPDPTVMGAVDLLTISGTAGR